MCLALNYPQLRKRKAWGGRIAKQLVRDGVIVKYLAGRNSHHSPNPCRCHCECLSRLGGSFGLFVDPMHNLMTFFGRWLAERRVMKMDKLSLQVLLLHYSKLPI